MSSAPAAAPVACCWISTARYSVPLDTTTAAKWECLQSLAIPMLVIGFAPSRTPRCFVQHARFLLLPQFRSTGVRYVSFVVASAVLTLWTVLARGVRVIVAQSPYEGIIAAAVKSTCALFGRRIAVVIESHGDFALDRRLYGGGFVARAANRLRASGARFALARADAFRAISSSTRAQLLDYADGRAIEEFITWTDTRAFLDPPRQVAAHDSEELLFAGVLAPVKGVDVLIAAFAGLATSFPRTRLRLVGRPGPAAYVSRLETQIRTAGLSPHVVFEGEVDQHTLARLMKSARALILPSRSEGFGRVILEAMLCRTPVVASRVGGVPDLIENGVTGFLVTPDRVDELGAALRHVLTASDIDDIAARAFERARDRFSAAQYVQGYRRLLESALERIQVRMPLHSAADC